ncbi:MAG: ATP-dependent helicase [Chitinophagaceae bacterium]|nr:MAG: ATP-dependent helicase [Chitinophagaceae bacterium]
MEHTKTSSPYALRLETKRPGHPGPVLELMKQDPAQKMAFLPPEKISARLVQQQFGDVPSAAQKAVLSFSEEAIAARRNELTKKHRTARSSVPLAEFVRDGLSRYQQECFATLRTHNAGLRILHAQKGEGGRVRLQSCRFLAHIPRLFFSVNRDASGLSLSVEIQVGEERSPITDWKRAQFLLERNNEYAVLTQRDAATLRRLDKLDLAQWSGDAAAFAANVLDELEADYPVARNQLFEEEVIDSVPQCRVHLSEMNSRYLVFTPAWNYEGLEVEGNWVAEQRRKGGGREWLIRRHRATEEAFVAQLRKLHPRFDNQLNGYFYLPFDEAQHKRWFLNTFYQLLESDVEVLGLGMLQHFRCSPHKPETVSELLSAPDDPQVRVRFQLKFGGEAVSLPALQKAIFSGQRIVLLRDGAMGVLPAEWFDTWATLLRHARIEKDVLTVPRWLALTGNADGAEGDVLRPVIHAGWWAGWQRWQKEPDALRALPSLLHADLRPYQQKGYEWLHLLQEAGAGACLADDMGLGKTLQTIAFLCSRIEADATAQQLIVCPASLVYNWKQEWNRFAPSVKVDFFQRDEKTDAPVQIATYHQVRASAETLAQQSFDTIVLDESHQVKNPAAQVTRAVGSLQGRFRIALSGTPVLNNTFDLYAQLNFLLPGMFGSREFFRQQYADAIDRNGDVEKIAALRRLTAPFLLRRTKEQVARDLPEKTEQVLWCTLASEQRMAYESIRDKVRSNILLDIEAKGLEQGRLSVLAGITKLKQVCCSAELVRDEDVFCTESVKIRVLLEELEGLVPGHKVLVFSQYTGMLDLLGNALRDAKLPFLRLDGSTPPEARQGLCNRFNSEDSEERVFLLSLKAGNAGLNLMAADYVFLFDNWWNAAVEQQAIDRTHRIGQTRPVFAYRMICSDTIEEKIWQLQQRKSKLSSELIQAEEGFVKSLTLDDVKFLLD